MTADYSLHTTASFVAADGTTLAVGAEVGADSYRLLAWNGRRWKALGEVGVPVVALWAFSAKDVWLGGTDPGTGYPVALRWNGTDAEMMTLEETEGVSVRSIWASGPSDVWMTAVKNDNALASLYHWDGQTWAREEIETVTTPPPSAGVGAAQQVQGLWGAGAGRPVLAVSCGVHHCGGKGFRVWERSGTAWSATEPELELFPTALTGMPNGTFVVAANDYGSDETMFVVGKGSAWTREPSGVTQEVDFLASTSTGEVWAVGGGGAILSRSADGWRSELVGRRDNFEDVLRLADGSILLAGADAASAEGRITRRSVAGALTTELAVPDGKVERLRAGADGTLWAVGNHRSSYRGFVCRSSGGPWKVDYEVTADVQLSDVAGTAEGTWAIGTEIPASEGERVGPTHVLKRAADGSWEDEAALGEHLIAEFFLQLPGKPLMFVATEDDTGFGGMGKAKVFGKGAEGWEEVASEDNIFFSDGAAGPGGTAYLFGHDNFNGTAAIYEFDGEDFERIDAIGDDYGATYLFRASQLSPDDVWVTGFSSNLGPFFVRKTPAEDWHASKEGPVTVVWMAIAAVSENEVWVAGYDGTLMKFDGGSDVAAGPSPGTAVLQSWHRSSVGADLFAWYGIPAALKPVSDFMDVVASIPYGGGGTFEFNWVPTTATSTSSLRLFTVEDCATARQFFLAPNFSPAPESAFEILGPDGKSQGHGVPLSAGTRYTIRFVVRDGGFTRHDLEPQPKAYRGSVLLTSY